MPDGLEPAATTARMEMGADAPQSFMEQNATLVITSVRRLRWAALRRFALGLAVAALLICPHAATAADYSFYTPPGETTHYPLRADGKVRNVILFIGDGMGLNQLTAASIAGCGTDGRTSIERMPVIGLLRTPAANALVTDSAAAATALATGHKTNNGMISVTPDGKKLKTILEAARDIGKSTGLVATYGLTHATPASFAGHVLERSDEATIATHLLENRVDVLLGGGRGQYLPQSQQGSSRKDDRNLLAEAKASGYQVAETKEGMDAVETGKILGLFQLGGLRTVAPEPSLAEMTAKAISLLSKNQKGFFLMVEGSQIDAFCHGNDGDNAIRQTLLMDQAVRVAMDYALQDSRTLVLVTNDHETGGMTINGGSMDGSKVDLKWTTGGHTASPAPLYAFGPHATRFAGVRDNTEVPRIIADLLGIKSFANSGE